jgi:hypothetical protein
MKRLDLQGEDVRRVPRGPRPRSPREAAPGSWANGMGKDEKVAEGWEILPSGNLSVVLSVYQILSNWCLSNSINFDVGYPLVI